MILKTEYIEEESINRAYFSHVEGRESLQTRVQILEMRKRSDKKIVLAKLTPALSAVKYFIAVNKLKKIRA